MSGPFDGSEGVTGNTAPSPTVNLLGGGATAIHGNENDLDNNTEDDKDDGNAKVGAMMNWLMATSDGKIDDQQALLLISTTGATDIAEFQDLKAEDLTGVGLGSLPARACVRMIKEALDVVSIVDKPAAPGPTHDARTWAQNGSKLGIKWSSGDEFPKGSAWNFYFDSAIAECDQIDGGLETATLAETMKRDIHGMTDETLTNLAALVGSKADRAWYRSMTKGQGFNDQVYARLESSITNKQSGLLLIRAIALEAEPAAEIEIGSLKSTIYTGTRASIERAASEITRIKNTITRLETNFKETIDKNYVLQMLESTLVKQHENTALGRSYNTLRDNMKRQKKTWTLEHAIDELYRKALELAGEQGVISNDTPARKPSANSAGDDRPKPPCLEFAIRNQCKRGDSPGGCRFAHPAGRGGKGLHEDELARWPTCNDFKAGTCEKQLTCIYKHGNGKAQLEAQRLPQVPSANAATGNRVTNQELKDQVVKQTAIIESLQAQGLQATAAANAAAADSANVTLNARLDEMQRQFQAAQQHAPPPLSFGCMPEPRTDAKATASNAARTAEWEEITDPAQRLMIEQITRMNDHNEKNSQGKTKHHIHQTDDRVTPQASEAKAITSWARIADCLVDGGANVVIVCPDQLPATSNMEALDPSRRTRIRTVSGWVSATHTCTLHTAAGDIDKALYVPAARQSLVAVSSLCDMGFVYTQDRNGASLVDANSNTVIKLQRRDGLHYLGSSRQQAGQHIAAAIIATWVQRTMFKSEYKPCGNLTAMQARAQPTRTIFWEAAAAASNTVIKLQRRDGFHYLGSSRKQADRHIAASVIATWVQRTMFKSECKPCGNLTAMQARTQPMRTIFWEAAAAAIANAVTRARLRPKLQQLKEAHLSPNEWGEELDFDLCEHLANKHRPWSKHCIDCVMAGLSSRPAKRNESGVAGEDLGWVVSFDLKGPIAKDLQGYRWAMVLVEAKTKYGKTFFTKSKSSDGMLAGLKSFLTELRFKAGPDAKVLIRTHADDGKEFMGEVTKWLKDNCITHTTTGGYRAKANPIVERRIKTILTSSRAMMLTCAGGDESYYEDLWALSMENANQAINTVPWDSTGISPHETLTGSEWDGSSSHVFGALAIYHVHKPQRAGALAPPSKAGIWVGADESVVGGHKVVPISYDYEARRWVLGAVLTATTVRVYDKVFPLRLGTPKPDEKRLDKFMERFSPWLPMPVIPHDAIIEPGDVADGSNVYEAEAIRDSKTVKSRKMYLVKWKGYPESDNSWEPARQLTDHGARDMVRKYEAGERWQLQASNAEAGIATAPSAADIVSRLLDKDGIDLIASEIDEWVHGYEKEITEMQRRRLVHISGEEADMVRKKRLAVRMRMIMKAKRDGRKKGRLVLQGFMEPSWWRTGPTDSPVVASSSIKTLVFMNGHQMDVLSSVDIEVAFLQADEFGPDEPTRYASYKPHPDSEEQFYRMLGPIYGSRDAGMRFYKTMKPWLLSQGFAMAENDPGLFYNASTGMRIGMHVDDLLVRGPMDATEEFYAALRDRFEIQTPTYLTPENPLEFLGIRITMTSEGEYYLDCEVAATDLLDKAGLGMVRVLKCPMPTTVEIASDPALLEADAATAYRSMVGGLNYLVCAVRFDLAHTASRLGQFSANPTVGAQTAMKRVLAYVAGTKSFKIGGPRKSGPDSYDIYSDSDHAGDKVLGTRSQSGMIITMNGVPVHWRSAKQPKTSVSVAAAEIHALSDAVQHARLLMWRCEELGLQTQKPLRIKVDNKQAESFAKATCMVSRLRGIFDLRDKWVQELRDAKQVQVTYVNGNANLADLFTKCLASGPFNRAVQAVQTGMRFS